MVCVDRQLGSLRNYNELHNIIFYIRGYDEDKKW
jgi:hypothetical protein